MSFAIPPSIYYVSQDRGSTVEVSSVAADRSFVNLRICCNDDGCCKYGFDTMLTIQTVAFEQFLRLRELYDYADEFRARIMETNISFRDWHVPFPEIDYHKDPETELDFLICTTLAMGNGYQYRNPTPAEFMSRWFSALSRFELAFSTPFSIERTTNYRLCERLFRKIESKIDKSCFLRDEIQKYTGQPVSVTPGPESMSFYLTIGGLTRLIRCRKVDQPLFIFENI